MVTFKLISANIAQCFIFSGTTYGEQSFSQLAVDEYISYFKKNSPDILAVTELPLGDQQGNSEVGEQFSKALGLPYWKTYGNEPSWLRKGKYYGTAIFSKYPIQKYEVFALPNPRIEIDRPDGSHWVMHNKGAQKASILIGDTEVVLFNIHYFPFHHFNRKMNDPEFADAREKLVTIISKETAKPVIVTGDFNHLGLQLSEAFPELLDKDLFIPAIISKTTLVGLHNQTDHILFTSSKLTLVKSSADLFLSDHYSLSSVFTV